MTMTAMQPCLECSVRRLNGLRLLDRLDPSSGAEIAAACGDTLRLRRCSASLSPILPLSFRVMYLYLSHTTITLRSLSPVPFPSLSSSSQPLFPLSSSLSYLLCHLTWPPNPLIELSPLYSILLLLLRLSLVPTTNPIKSYPIRSDPTQRRTRLG